jgi:uncharacterized protein (TIGR02246 family)
MTRAHRVRAWLPLMLSWALLLPNVVNGQGIEKPRVPVRTALDELRVLRNVYAEAFNKNDTATLVNMYAPGAVVITGEGKVLTGKDAIQKDLETPRPGPRPKMSITVDTTRVFGNTAYEVGTVHMSHSEGADDVSHCLVVLRRGVTTWSINSLACVRETSKANN